MKNKIIIVPKNNEARILLNYDRTTPEQLIEVVLNEAEFKKLWDTGFFGSINSIADVNIDDYEDESIEEKEKLEKVLASNIFSSNVSNKINQIKSLFEEALKRGTGIYFYF